MDSFWLKAIVAVIVIVGAVIGINMLMPKRQDQPKEQPKTIYDMAKQDRKDLLTEPNTSDFENAPQTETGPVTLYFKEVSEIESIDAENMLAPISSFRTIGRLPFTGYNAMVESCRLLIRRYPGTIYDYKARRALAQIPQQYWDRYKITDEEVSLDYFKTPRPDTKPYTITEED
jgi:hypothetical protein